MISHGGILESIASHLWAVSWQVSILIALIWISSLFGRKSSSNFRYWLWCIVIVRLCVPTGLTLPLHFDLHLKNAVVSQISTMTTEHSEPEKTPSVQPLNTVSAPNPERVKDIQVPEKTTIVPPLSITAVIGLLWLAGVLSILTVIIWRVLRLQKRLKSSPVITRPDLREMLRKLSRDMGIKRPIHLHYMELERINSPAVSGIINLRIYLPRHIADTWSLEELKPVLLHELAHIRRLDMIVNWLQIVLQALYFFHPLLWYANREIRRLREEVCDDLAIHHLGFEKNQYSQSIVNVVRNMGRQPVFGSIGIGFTERKNSLSERIGRIMNDSYRRYTKMKVSSIAALVFIGIVSVGIASAKPFSEKKADTSKSAQKESEEYSSKVILDLKWGDGPDEIGFIQIDQDKFGPGAFNVNNEGLIYILDSMHSRVIVFDQNGKPVRRFLVEIGSDRVKYILGKVNLGMDIDEHNNVWVIIGTNYIIHQYTAEGILQKSIKFNPGQTRAVRRDITLRNGEIFLGGGKIEITKKITASGEKGESVYEAIKKELIKNKQPRGIASRIGKISKRMYSVPYVLEKGVPTLEKGVPTIIQVIEENGTMNEIILEGIKTPYWAVLMDEDMHGNAYFSIRYPVNKLPRQIWKLNPDFELLAKIAPIPRKNITSPYVKDWDIDDEGNIYIMQIIDSGVQVIKWSEVNKAEDVKEKVTDFTGVKSPPEKKEPAPSPNIDEMSLPKHFVLSENFTQEL